MKKEEAIEILEELFDMYDAFHEVDFESMNWERMQALNLAVEALKRDDPEEEFQKRFEKTTFCGYSPKELLLFADACRRQGITEYQLHIFLINTESAFNYVMEKINEMFDEEIERQLS